MDKSVSERIYIMKAAAIFSAVSAHLAGNVSTAAGYTMSNILHNIGALGVPIFLFFAGYFFIGSVSKYTNSLQFIVKKLDRLLIPWIVSGSFIYFQLIALYHPKNWRFWFENIMADKTLWGFIKYIAGYNTFYYFMSILLCCYLVFLVIYKNSKYIVFLMLLSLIHILFFYKSDFLTPYINPFNWFFYFGCGVCFAKYKYYIGKFAKKVDKVVSSKLILIGGGGIIAGVLFVMSLQNIIIGYWHPYFIIYLAIISLYLYILSYHLQKVKHIGTVLVFVGKQSFYIYLYHMGLQGPGIRFSLVLMRPVIVVTALCILAYGLKILSKRTTYLQAVISTLSGINLK